MALIHISDLIAELIRDLGNIGDNVTDGFNKPAPPAAGRGQAEDRADGVPRDGRGGYVLPGLDGSPPLMHKNRNPIGRVRASTIKNHVTDKTGVEKWKREMVVRGLTKDPGLMAEAMKATAADDKGWIRAVSDKAATAGGAKISANRGTEFHELTERIKKGEQVSPDEIHESLAAVDVDAYLQVLEQVGLRPVPGMQERVVLLDHGGGGTFDDMFEWFNPETEQYELLIGDTKSGADIWKYGSLEIIVQMIQYVRALGIWRSPKDGGAEPWGDYLPMPAVSQNHVAIVHCPQNGTAEAFIVDITGAQEVVDAALTIRRWQSDAKHRVHSIGKVDLREDAFVTPPADGPWAPVRQETPSPDVHNVVDPIAAAGYPALSRGIAEQAARTKTPDQIAQEVKAQERLAKVAAMANPNTDGDNEQVTDAVKAAFTNSRQTETETETAREQAAAQVDPLFGPLAPLAGPGKKGCSVCGRTGHRKGSPKCLGENDPLALETRAKAKAFVTGTDPSMAKVVKAFPGQVTAQELAEYNRSQAPHIDDQPRTTLTQALDQVATAYCLGQHPGVCEWTAQHPDAPGQWVCSVTGKPSREAYEQAVTRASAAAIEPVPGVGVELVTTQMSEPWPAKAPTIMDSLQALDAQPNVLTFRQYHIDQGTWSDELEAAAASRYQALA